MRDYKLYLKDILESMESIEKFVEGRLIHFYFVVDYKLVWETIKERIPQVKPLIKRILEKL